MHSEGGFRELISIVQFAGVVIVENLKRGRLIAFRSLSIFTCHTRYSGAHSS